MGFSGMQFFFIVSGFVLCYVSQGKRDHYDLGAGAAFLLHRVVRLGPPFYVALCWLSLISGGEEQLPFVAWPIDAAFAQSLVPIKLCDGPHLPLAALGIAWFTSAILVLSACFPFLFN